MAREATFLIEPTPAGRGKHTAAADISAGAVIPLATCCAVADIDIANTKTGIVHFNGKVSIKAETGVAWAAGDVIYWDDTNNQGTKTSTSNTIMGRAGEPKGSTAAVGVVLLGFGI